MLVKYSMSTHLFRCLWNLTTLAFFVVQIHPTLLFFSTIAMTDSFLLTEFKYNCCCSRTNYSSYFNI